MDWMQKFEEIGALWHHDKNPARPYALLTSGKISNLFFNGSKVIERPELLEAVADELVAQAKKEIGNLRPSAVVGPAHGAITLAYAVAKRLPPARAWFTETETNKEAPPSLKRFDGADNAEDFLAVEDVITTGGSALLTIEACKRKCPKLQAYPFVMCIVNRSGSKQLRGARDILALLNIPAKTWDRGRNPFTPDGQERVEPVRPKSNWHTLTRPY